MSSRKYQGSVSEKTQVKLKPSHKTMSNKSAKTGTNDSDSFDIDSLVGCGRGFDTVDSDNPETSKSKVKTNTKISAKSIIIPNKLSGKKKTNTQLTVDKKLKTAKTSDSSDSSEESDKSDDDTDIKKQSIKKTHTGSKKIAKDKTDNENEEEEKTKAKDKTVSKKKPKTKSQRVTLYLNDDDAKPVTAAGALFYKKVGKQMMVLVIENDSKYEDIGGKIDPDDEDIVAAASREIEEETNGIIKAENVIERLRTATYIYVPRSKYVIYLVEANAEEKKLKKNDFGDREEHDGFPRTIGWMAREELAKPAIVQFKMNWRMKCKSLFEKLTDIETHFKFKNNMFKNKKKE